MLKGPGFYDRHIAFMRSNVLATAAVRGGTGKNVWLDRGAGPWPSQMATNPMFRAGYVKHDVTAYLDIRTQSRDALYGGTLSSGVTGAQLMTIETVADPARCGCVACHLGGVGDEGTDAERGVVERAAAASRLRQCVGGDTEFSTTT